MTANKKLMNKQIDIICSLIDKWALANGSIDMSKELNAVLKGSFCLCLYHYICVVFANYMFCESMAEIDIICYFIDTRTLANGNVHIMLYKRRFYTYC